MTEQQPTTADALRREWIKRIRAAKLIEIKRVGGNVLTADGCDMKPAPWAIMLDGKAGPRFELEGDAGDFLRTVSSAKELERVGQAIAGAAAKGVLPAVPRMTTAQRDALVQTKLDGSWISDRPDDALRVAAEAFVEAVIGTGGPLHEAAGALVRVVREKGIDGLLSALQAECAEPKDLKTDILPVTTRSAAKYFVGRVKGVGVPLREAAEALAEAARAIGLEELLAACGEAADEKQGAESKAGLFKLVPIESDPYTIGVFNCVGSAETHKIHAAALRKPMEEVVVARVGKIRSQAFDDLMIKIAEEFHRMTGKILVVDQGHDIEFLRLERVEENDGTVS